MPPEALVPAWAAHGEGRLAATQQHLDEIVAGDHLAFVYAHADGRVDVDAVPNGSALGCAGLVNRAGNVLAIMPHPERDAWNFNHLDRREGEDVLAPSGGAVLFRSFVDAVADVRMKRTIAISLKIPDNTAYTALVALRRLGVAVERVERSEIWFFDDDAT